MRRALLASCVTFGAMSGACVRDTPSRALVQVQTSDPAAVTAALAVVERHANSVPGVARTVSVGCENRGATVAIANVKNVDATRAIQEAITAHATELPAGITPVQVRAVAPDIAVLSVRGDNVFDARAFVDATLAPALRALPGVHEVSATGGRRERQLRLDPERLLATDLSVPEVLAAVRLSSSLEKAIVKTYPNSSVVIRLTDVANIEDTSAGERARKDGGVVVHVRGAPSAQRQVRAQLAQTAAPAGITVNLLDDDSVEVVTVLVVPRGDASLADPQVQAAVDSAFADVTAAALSVPGIHSYRRGRALSLTLDAQRLRGMSTKEKLGLADVAATVTGGLTINAKDGPVKVTLAAAATPEALLRTRVTAPQPGVPARRLFDVARAALAEEQRSDRLDGKPARRLRLSFDAGVRQRALDELERRIAAVQQARPGVTIATLRDADTAPIDAICP